MPAWMFKKYPDVARVDYQGRRHVFGQRHNFCSNSKNYQVLASKLVKKIVSRYYKILILKFGMLIMSMGAIATVTIVKILLETG